MKACANLKFVIPVRSSGIGLSKHFYRVFHRDTTLLTEASDYADCISLEGYDPTTN